MQTLQLGPVPEWLAVALVTAALAALGFIGKQVHEWIVTVNAARRTRRARLVTLLSLLNGTAEPSVGSGKRFGLLIGVPAMDPAELTVVNVSNLRL